MKKKILACLLAGAMVLSLAACGETTSTSTDDSTAEAVEETVEEEEEEVEAEVEEVAEETTATAEAVEASIDFEDGNYGFVAAYAGRANSAELEFSLAEFAGSTALKVTNLDGNKPYVSIDVDALLGDDVEKIASIEVSIGVERDGSFSAVSGYIYAWLYEAFNDDSDSWSVYLESANPKTATYTPSTGCSFTAGAGNVITISLETDNGPDEGNGAATMYIDNIRFLDADGNLISVSDTSVAFVGPEGFGSTGTDYTNLCLVSNAVYLDGFELTGDAWSQNGIEMTDEFLAALVPGSVIEVEYSSEYGEMWIVMPWADAGWIRVGVGNNDGSGSDSSYTNNSKSIMQITYEQIAALCGDDTSTWGAMIQCESNGSWEVYSMKVGTANPNYVLTNTVELEGFEVSADGWCQDGIEMTEEFLAALVPGSVIEIQYSSEYDDLWIVMPWADAGWIRVGWESGDGTPALCTGSVCYVTYEQIAALCGDDTSTWGAMLQCESSGSWEVYSVTVGTGTSFAMLNNLVELEGFEISGSGWGQDGLEMTEEFLAALVPGSVIQIEYESEGGELWIVMPWADAGWIRVGVGDYDGSGQGYAVFDGSICQITYEMIAEYCGDDTSTWGAMLQCEASTAWTVYSVSVGQSAN